MDLIQPLSVRAADKAAVSNSIYKKLFHFRIASLAGQHFNLHIGIKLMKLTYDNRQKHKGYAGKSTDLKGTNLHSIMELAVARILSSHEIASRI